MFHIVFQKQDIAVLNQAMDLDEALDGEVLLIADDYAVGPLSGLSSEAGRESRRQWWRNILSGGIYEGIVDDGSVPDDEQTIRTLQERMCEEAFDEIWIWVASNQHDVSGYYRIISQLKEFAGRVYILSLNNLPFINDKGAVFYPSSLFEIPAREFKKAKRLARPVTLAEFEIDSDEWNRLSAENKDVRILEGAKKLVQHDDNYFDAGLKKYLTNDLQKPARLVHAFLSKSPVRTGDAFLFWRLKELTAAGELVEEGGLIKSKQREPV